MVITLAAGAIVRERERGNMELLITTPLRSVELMVGTERLLLRSDLVEHRDERDEEEAG